MKTTAILLAVLVAAHASPLRAVELDLRTGLTSRDGDWTYQIGRSATVNGQTETLPFPISELEWPMAAGGLMLGATVETGTLVISADVSVFGGEDGIMKDSDWEDEANPKLRTLYSETDTELLGFEGDVSLGVRLLGGGMRGNTGGLHAGAGFLFQRWEWEGRDTRQVEVGEPVGVYLPGRTIDYTGELAVPYLQIAGHLPVGKVRLTGRVGYSPWASVSDTDDHRLRGIKAKADTDGDALIADAGVDIPMSDTWGFFANAHLLWFETKGTSNNQVYRATGRDELPQGQTWKIEQEIETLQAGFTAGVRFAL